MNYKTEYREIPVAVYRHLRVACGLSAKTAEAASLGLKNSLCSVAVQTSDTGLTIGMGRLIGDGGCHAQVVDICVLPEHQGKGLGKEVVSKLKEYIDRELPESCYVSLIADGEAFKLYELFGFKEVWPNSRGMGFKK